MYSYFQKLNKVLSNTRDVLFFHWTAIPAPFFIISAFGNTLLTGTSASPTLPGILTLCISASKTNSETLRVPRFYIAKGKPSILKWMPS